MATPLRVGVYYRNDDVRVEERPVPDIGPGELLVKVWASGICGSDVMEWYRISKAPLVLGHEIGGEVVRTGNGVQEFNEGDRVFVSHHVPCNMCHYCLKDHHSTCAMLKATNFDPGGFSEFVRIPAVNVTNGTFKLPASMGFEEAVFIEPLGCVYRGQRRAGLHAGDTVAVLGSGLTGLLHIRLAKALGAGMVLATDVLESRLDAASDCGADECCMAGDDLVTRLRSCNDGQLADLVIVATGAPPALKQAFDLVDAGGTILFFAPSTPDLELSMPFNRLWADEVSIVTTYAASPKDIKVAIELIRTGRVPVKDLISHRLPLSEIQKGFDLVADPVDSLKVIIEPQR